MSHWAHLQVKHCYHLRVLHLRTMRGIPVTRGIDLRVLHLRAMRGIPVDQCVLQVTALIPITSNKLARKPGLQPPPLGHVPL